MDHELAVESTIHVPIIAEDVDTSMISREPLTPSPTPDSMITIEMTPSPELPAINSPNIETSIPPAITEQKTQAPDWIFCGKQDYSIRTQ